MPDDVQLLICTGRLINAVLTQAALDVQAGYEHNSGESDARAFLDAAGMLGAVPQLVARLDQRTGQAHRRYHHHKRAKRHAA